MKFTNWLNRVLENKESRQKKQWELCERYNSPVLSLTINIPGSKKDSLEAKYIFQRAAEEIEKLTLKTHEKLFTCKDTGYEALWSFDIDAKELKRLSCGIEENHPLGRFMDIDVIDVKKQILSRGMQRRCYICKKSAKICAKNQTHSIEELLSYISKKVNDYKTSL